MDKPVAAPAVGAKEKIDKQARQLAYDTRYKVKQSMKAKAGGRVDPAAMRKAFISQLMKSPSAPAIKARAKQMLMGEGYIDVKDLVKDHTANALYKVFVEQEQEELKLAYLQQLDEDEDNRKYKVRVTDKNGRAYVRFADRAKITELRQNPNIESVEMTDHGEPYEGERKKGKMTAKAKGGGLDPVGKEDKDIDNDGDHDKTDKYLLKRRKAIGKAIRTRAEAYLADGTISTEPKNPTKITGADVNNYASGAVKVSPDDGSDVKKRKGVYAHLELQGNPLSEGQKKMLEMYDTKKKKEEEDKGKLTDMATKDSVKKDDEKKEEKPDNRGMYAKIAMIKNKLRSAGQRDPMVMAVDACEEKTGGSELHKAGGPNSQYEKDGSKKRKKIAGEFPGTTKEFNKKYGLDGQKVNPYGKNATANPENMSSSSGG